jgi:hypothetical protein
MLSNRCASASPVVAAVKTITNYLVIAASPPPLQESDCCQNHYQCLVIAVPKPSLAGAAAGAAAGRCCWELLLCTDSVSVCRVRLQGAAVGVAGAKYRRLVQLLSAAVRCVCSMRPPITTVFVLRAFSMRRCSVRMPAAIAQWDRPVQTLGAAGRCDYFVGSPGTKAKYGCLTPLPF